MKNKNLLAGFIALLLIINSAVIVVKADNGNNITTNNLICSSGLIADNYENQTIKTYISQFVSNNPCVANVDFSNNEKISSWLSFVNENDLPVIPNFSNEYYGAYVRYFDNQDRIDLMCFSSSQPVFYFAGIGEGGHVVSLGSDLVGKNLTYRKNNNNWSVTISDIGIESASQSDTTFYRNNFLTDVVNLFGSSTVLYSAGFPNAIGATPLTVAGLSSILASGTSDPFDYAYHKFTYDGNSLSDVVPDAPQEESFKNHMYMSNVLVGLYGGSEPLNSQIVIGCKVDNFLSGYADNTTVQINYGLGYVSSAFGNVSAYDTEFSSVEFVPLNALINGYKTECLTIFDKSLGMGYNPQFAKFRSLYDYMYSTYNASYKAKSYKANNLKDFSSFNFDSLYGFNLESATYNSDGNLISIVPYIEKYGLTVSLKLITEYDGESAESGVYTVYINFLNGNSSILNAAGLNNNDPWFDENTPSGSVINSNNGTSIGSGSNVAYGGNANVNVNVNSWANVDNNITSGDADGVKNARDTLNESIGVVKDTMNSFTNESDNNGILQFLGEMTKPFFDWAPLKAVILTMFIIALVVFIFHIV